MTTDYILVHTTFPDRTKALAIAKTLVEEGLVACVSIDTAAATAVYQWEGTLEESDEFAARLKTRADRFGSLSKRLTELHPYEVPEIVATPISLGSPDYLDWINQSLES